MTMIIIGALATSVQIMKVIERLEHGKKKN
jgi:hypothetical protein